MLINHILFLRHVKVGTNFVLTESVKVGTGTNFVQKSRGSLDDTVVIFLTLP